MKTKKNNNNVTIAEVNNNNNNVTIEEVNKTQFSCAMHEAQEVNDHVVVVDMSRAVLCDYMKMSRIAMFRLLVKKDASFDVIARHDFLFYRNTNDRSKTRSVDKKEDLNKYCRENRTKKQLADVLKEKDVMTFLCNKYNVKSYLTVNQYIATVK